MSTFSVTNQGVITVDTSSIKSDFEEAYKQALGFNLNLESSTPQGQLIINDTETLTTAMNEVVNIANNISVYRAKGNALDIIAAAYGYYRKQGVATTVYLNITGSDNTIIPLGSIVSDGTHEYKILNEVTISSGVANVWAQCTEKGEIYCPAQTVTTIVSTISGWDTVNNQTTGVTGYNTETDNEFRNRITQNWLNIRARSILGAIVDNIYALDNVISVVGRENPTKNTATIDGQSLVANSIYLCVLGGDNDAIADILSKQKTLGADTNGNTNVTFFDESTGHRTTYLIQRPSVINISVQVSYEANNYTSSTAESQMSSLIMNWLAENPLKIGQTISGSLLAQSLDGFNQVNLLAFKVKASGDDSYSDYKTATISEVGVVNEITFNEVS